MTPTLVVTSIAPPTAAMKALAEGARARGIPFYCVGDRASPAEYELPGCEFLALDRQRNLPYRYAELAPERHYARKNIGYLHAIATGAGRLLETDDDNFPGTGFWTMDAVATPAVQAGGQGWFNVYEYFGADAWPRGFPLERVLASNSGFTTAAVDKSRPLVWQGLVAGDPDVDAIYRLTRRDGAVFDHKPGVLLGPGVWSPFNSQNTLWARAAFPLLYLPATCSFRATDIIRGYVATRCLWELEAGVMFLAPTAVQERNRHDLLQDFADEVIIYSGAGRIAAALQAQELERGVSGIIRNLCRCYETLVDMEVVQPGELGLLAAWCADIEGLG